MEKDENERRAGLNLGHKLATCSMSSCASGSMGCLGYAAHGQQEQYAAHHAVHQNQAEAVMKVEKELAVPPLEAALVADVAPQRRLTSHHPDPSATQSARNCNLAQHRQNTAHSSCENLPRNNQT